MLNLFLFIGNSMLLFPFLLIPISSLFMTPSRYKFGVSNVPVFDSIFPNSIGWIFTGLYVKTLIAGQVWSLVQYVFISGKKIRELDYRWLVLLIRPNLPLFLFVKKWSNKNDCYYGYRP